MLVAATDDHFAALIAGTMPDGLRVPEAGVESLPVLEMLLGLARTVREQISPSVWMIVEDGEGVGLCSITKAFPAPATVEIGYGVAAARRDRGHASRAIGELLELARANARISIVTAETSTDNVPSQRVLERNGFARTGTRIDAEDGPLICWQIVVG